jgi:hypothetical protein
VVGVRVEGDRVGMAVGVRVGEWVGVRVDGDAVGVVVSVFTGGIKGWIDGVKVGDGVGSKLTSVGAIEGVGVVTAVGGRNVGARDGGSEGAAADGDAVGIPIYVYTYIYI